ncbi:SDR family NAD(P)-dependent oxidoreductase [Sphingobium boeckii]|uniref:NAD(P)-dependent dehydrogenase (Short-subunit alcohol dehydrogenase family) n=1 Tax=Sphingobium boeckii TaxID=1082345 RepID=A0A7W9AJC2_9SPHN|nr:SDR family oxidoreductase [Sphingobium boeckii]MBB5686768.1 NAD(P)-dependent dehydrogenase (short-subunit alcohol dehydrogenase family) [Sphingobium boeckii]
MANGLFDCTGKVTLVTGGNGGIGLGFARGVAKMGGDIAIWARNEGKNAEAKAELLAAGAGRVETYQVDVVSEEAIIQGYADLLADFGRVDCVFANSGRASKSRSVLTLDSAEWHDLLAVNLHGAFFTLREGAKAMVKRAEVGEPGGSLVYCGSLSMFHGIAGINNYAASKGGMGAVIRGMAAELGQYGIRANTIAPGYIKTGIGQGDIEMSEEMKVRLAQVDAHFSAKTPIHRPGRPEDFEGMGAYLTSDASSYHSGDTIVIDGGSLIYPPYAF